MIKEKGLIISLKDIDICGHRVVHGGDLNDSILLSKTSISHLKKFSELAPLHNPVEVKVIELCKKIIGCPQVAVFDTSFFQTLPETAFLYAIPRKYYEKYGIRRYGFHGTSHRYIAEQVQKKLGKSKLRIISCHLGNGASIAAIKDGKAVDISMGLTPLEGLIMGTRSGDIDPGAVLYLMKKERIRPDKMDSILNKESGLLGISGQSKDVRDLLKSKDKNARTALKMFCFRLKKYIGAYAAALGGVDVLVFTAGIGEHIYYLKNDLFKDLDFLGIKVDPKMSLNAKHGGLVSSGTSKVKVMVLHTDEELMIVKDCLRLG